MAALFACTKCHGRFPFEGLSHSDQLCKDCRSHFPVVKCTYCRIEFQLTSKGSSSTVCEKCSQNVKVYGKPKACQYCSVLAAFIGGRCQRCVSSEKKWGPPVMCEQCKQKCAYQRRDGSKKKVDGRQLCWLCTQAYKRVLAKTRSAQDLTRTLKRVASSSLAHTLQAGADNKSSLAAAIMRMASSNIRPTPTTTTTTAVSAVVSAVTSSEKKSSAVNGHHHGHHKHHSRSHSAAERSSNQPAGSSLSTERKEEGMEGGRHRSRSRRHHHHSQSKPAADCAEQSREEVEEASPSKKPHLEKVLSNGVSTPKSTGSNVSDMGVAAAAAAQTVEKSSGSENVILITQLREQIESLKKQLTARDAQLLEKDKRINELKAENYEAEKDARTKVHTLQKQHEDAINNLLTKHRELQRQVTRLSKGVKKSVLDAITNSSG